MRPSFASASAVAHATREFALQVMRPAGIALDRMSDPEDTIAPDSPMWKVHREFRQAGLHLPMISTAFGGMAESMPHGGVERLHQELGYGDAGLAIGVAASTMPFMLAMLASDRRVRNMAQHYALDKKAELVGCWGITEPGHGSDWVLGTTAAGADPRTAPDLTATKDGGDYILNGQKSAWVSNGTIATHAVLHVGLDASKGMHGYAVGFCPLDLPGVSKGPPLNKLGQRPLNQGEIFFDEVRLPSRYMLFFNPSLLALDGVMRLGLGVANQATGVTMSGLARAAYEEALAFAKTPDASGRSPFDQKPVRLKMFQMYARQQACSAMALRHAAGAGRSGMLAQLGSNKLTFAVMGRFVRHVVENFDELSESGWLAKRIERVRREGGFNQGRTGIATKVYCTQAAADMASDALQIIGQAGLQADHPIQKMLRDAQTSIIEDGSNECLALAGSVDL